MTYTMYCKVIK